MTVASPVCPTCGSRARNTLTEYGERHDCCGLTSWGGGPLVPRGAKHDASRQEAVPVFVFGSNLAGRHGKGGAYFALMQRGAVYGQAEGRQGNSYAIPTKDAQFAALPLGAIEQAVRRFHDYAREHADTTFQVTAVGCGLAGYKPLDIAPMFDPSPVNCVMPSEFRGANITRLHRLIGGSG